MSEENGKEVGSVVIRPVQFVWSVISSVERDGKIITHDKTDDVMIMEVNFDKPFSVAESANKVKEFMEKRYNGGNAPLDGG